MDFKQFQVKAKAAGLQAVPAPKGGYWKLLGSIAPVMYYPATGTIFVQGQIKATEWGDGDKAIFVALNGPRLTGNGLKARNRNLRKRKLAMYRENQMCHWCGLVMDPEEVTVDHLVPLARGGSNRKENSVLAHKSCNEKRGAKWTA